MSNINEQITQSLREAGIGMEYTRQEATLTSLGKQGKRAAELVRGEWQDATQLGRVWFIQGDSPEATDWVHLLCRGFLINRVQASIVSLQLLTSTMAMPYESKNEALHAMQESQVLHITDFYNAFYAAENQNALPSGDRFKMEAFLRAWVTEGRSLVLQGSKALATCDWWSPSFLSELERRVTFTVSV